MPSPGEYANTTLHGWTLTLLHEFDRIRQATPQLRCLTRPNLRFADDLSHALGQWDATRRCITLAARVVRECAWEDAVAVFRHEVAHQVASEIFGGDGEPPHGPAFRRACTLIGAPEQATFRPLRTSTDKNRTMRRIQKLLALGQSPNQHEAERALAKARILMARHNLELQEHSDGSDCTFRIIGRAQRQTPSYIWQIMCVLTDFYFVRYISRTHRNVLPDGRSERRAVLEVYGRPDNLDVAEYVYHFLLDHGHRLWHRFRLEQGLRNDRQKLSFLKGLYRGVWETLDRQRAESAATETLVWKGDPALNDYYRRRNPRIRHSRRASQLYEEAHRAGQARGRELRIHRAVRDASTGRAGPALLED